MRAGERRNVLRHANHQVAAESPFLDNSEGKPLGTTFQVIPRGLFYAALKVFSSTGRCKDFKRHGQYRTDARAAAAGARARERIARSRSAFDGDDGIEPLRELGAHVIEIAEGAAIEE